MGRSKTTPEITLTGLLWIRLGNPSENSPGEGFSGFFFTGIHLEFFKWFLINSFSDSVSKFSKKSFTSSHICFFKKSTRISLGIPLKMSSGMLCHNFPENLAGILGLLLWFRHYIRKRFLKKFKQRFFQNMPPCIALQVYPTYSQKYSKLFPRNFYRNISGVFTQDLHKSLPRRLSKYS